MIMVSEKVQSAFLERFRDEKLQKRLAAAKNPREALEVVKAEGFDVGLEDFKESMQRLSDYLNPKQGELSDSDLEHVAGGAAKKDGGLGDLIPPGPIPPGRTGPIIVGPGPAASAAA